MMLIASLMESPHCFESMDSWLLFLGFADLLGPQKAVRRTATGDVESRDPVHWVVAYGDRALASACARAGSVKRANGAGNTYKAVIHTVGVNVLSRHRAHWVEVLGHSALAGARSRAGSVKRG